MVLNALFQAFRKGGKYSMLSTLPKIHIRSFDLVKICSVKQISGRTLIKRADMTICVVLNFRALITKVSVMALSKAGSWAEPGLHAVAAL